jgi:hypothetical protein
LPTNPDKQAPNTEKHDVKKFFDFRNTGEDLDLNRRESISKQSRELLKRSKESRPSVKSPIFQDFIESDRYKEYFKTIVGNTRALNQIS